MTRRRLLDVAAQALGKGFPDLREEIVAITGLGPAARRQRLAATVATHRRALGLTRLMGLPELVEIARQRVEMLEAASGEGLSS